MIQHTSRATARVGSRPDASAPLRILYVEPIGDSRGHEGEFTSRLCQAFAAAGHAVTVCTNRLHTERFMSGAPPFRVVEVEGGRYGFEQAATEAKRAPVGYAGAFLRNSWVVMRRALQLLRHESFDAVYIIDTDRVVMTMLLKAARLSGVRLPPVVVEIHASNFSFREYPGGLMRRSWKWVQKQLLASSAGSEIWGIHTIGEYQADGLRRQLQLDARGCPVFAITEGVDLPERLVDRSEARRRLNLEVTGTLLVMFGTLRRDKGVENVLRAAGSVRGGRGDWTLLIVGNPVDYTPAELSRLAAESGAGERVRLRPQYVSEEDMFLYFRAADGAVFPYRNFYTGGTGPLRKACACACPVIATDVSEMGRLVAKHGFGVLVRPEDPMALAAGIEQFLDSSEAERERLGLRGHEFAAANTWSAMAASLGRVFEQAAAERVG